MRPIPLAAGFHACRPGKVSRAAKLGSSAIANGDTLSAMPLAVTDLTNSRRDILIVPCLSSAQAQLLRMMRCRAAPFMCQRRSLGGVSGGIAVFGLRAD